MSTYSLSVKGAPASHVLGTQTLKIDDATGGTTGAQKLSMSRGTAVPCQRPDGSIRNYQIDAERSRPGVFLVMNLL